jgi:hypothetical protein
VVGSHENVISFADKVDMGGSFESFPVNSWHPRSLVWLPGRVRTDRERIHVVGEDIMEEVEHFFHQRWYMPRYPTKPLPAR